MILEFISSVFFMLAGFAFADAWHTYKRISASEDITKPTKPGADDPASQKDT